MADMIGRELREGRRTASRNQGTGCNAVSELQKGLFYVQFVLDEGRDQRTPFFRGWMDALRLGLRGRESSKKGRAKAARARGHEDNPYHQRYL